MGMKWSRFFDKKTSEELIVVDDNKQLPDARKISVPDLKQYLLDGYKEIRQVKQEREELKQKLEDAQKYKQLYEATLITLEEFKLRDAENQENIKQLEEKLNVKNNIISDLNETIADYAAKEHKIENILENIEDIKKQERKNSIKFYKEKLVIEIENYRGNISKSKLINLINCIKGE